MNLQSTAQQSTQAKELDFYADLNDFLTTDEVAKILKVSNSYLAKLRFESYNKGKDGSLRADFLPFFKVGKSVRYKKSDVLAWIERNMVRG
ncbi:MAG: helix-turn-helix domain-containing protein [Campylobacter sp.]|nr:helix-turn-helix domain-containing protein [Campylobacter sp.]